MAKDYAPYVLGGAGIGGLAGYLSSDEHALRNAVLGAITGGGAGAAARRLIDEPVAASATEAPKPSAALSGTPWGAAIANGLIEFGMPADRAVEYKDAILRTIGAVGLGPMSTVSVGGVYIRNVFDPAVYKTNTPHEDMVFERLKRDALASGKVHAINSSPLSDIPGRLGVDSAGNRIIEMNNRNPGVLAHEIGHAPHVKPVQFAQGPWAGPLKQLGNISAMLANASAGSDGDNAALAATVLGTAPHLPGVFQEIGASRRGAQLLRAQNMRGRGAFIGLPSYLLSALVPSASYAASRLSNRAERVPTPVAPVAPVDTSPD